MPRLRSKIPVLKILYFIYLCDFTSLAFRSDTGLKAFCMCGYERESRSEKKKKGKKERQGRGKEGRGGLQRQVCPAGKSKS